MRIGIDTGGTFTDVVVVEGGALFSFKLPSTPGDPSRAILDALDRARRSRPRPHDPFQPAIVHGSTVATNAVLEGKTARAALVTTAGFEDLLEIGRQARPSLYDIEVQRPRPLIPASLRFGVAERLLSTGEVRTPLDALAVRAAGEAARRAGAVSCAVCFLHSYLRPHHEEEAGRILEEIFPGGVTLSSSLVREFREYERFSTAAMNACLAPVVSGYLGRLVAGAGGGSIRIMGSNGGSLSPRRAAAEAAATLLSGPAAGVVAARRIAASAGFEDVISFDMGGTSTDVSLIPGRILFTGEAVVSGYPVKLPIIDIHTVGAGGGSVAWIDQGSALKVGPMSAGAEPGPACYGRGGPATVTDANLLLGRIIPERFLGGAMKLDLETSRSAVARVASRLGLGIEDAAAGILGVANVTMARAIRQVSLYRGLNPAGFTLCAFGGAGGLHAADLVEATGAAGALIPPSPGLLSAWGLLASDITVHRSATILAPASQLRGGALEAALAPLIEEAMRAVAEEAGPDRARAEAEIQSSVDARYAGQSHEIQVPARGDWLEGFHRAHEVRHGFCRREEEVIVVTLRAVARIPVEAPPRPRAAGASFPPEPRRVWDEGGYREGRGLGRESLPAGATLAGPAVITEPGSTIFVPSRFSATMLEDGSLRLERMR